MASAGTILTECVEHLKNSSHDYEKLLGSSVDSVWRTISASVERQLRLKKGVGVPQLGKFSFIRDLQPLTPVFLLADRFASSYGVAWRRPPPALLIPVTDVNMSAIGSEAGGLPKDLVAKTLDAILAFIGGRLKKDMAAGKLRLGNVGYFLLDGKSLAFHFDPGFVKSIVVPASENGSHTKGNNAADHVPTTQQPVSSGVLLPRGASLQLLTPVSALSIDHQPIKHDVGTVETRSHKIQQRHERHHKHRSANSHDSSVAAGDDDDGNAVPCTTKPLHRHHRQSKSTGELAQYVDDALSSDTQNGKSSQKKNPTNAESSATLQILPRFMLPDPRRTASLALYQQQAASMQRAFENKKEELLARHVESIRQDDEIAKRTQATRLRCVQERAQKTVNQRDLEASLNAQIDEKHRDKQRVAVLVAKATDFEAVRVVPRDRIVTQEERHQAKLKLRHRLHEQVQLNDSLAKQNRFIDRAESAYFMTKVQEQAAREDDERRQQQRIAREALTAGWRQQQLIQEQCETRQPTHKTLHKR